MLPLRSLSTRSLYKLPLNLVGDKPDFEESISW